MDHTEKSFSDKWTKNPDLVFSETTDEKSDIFKWIITRNGFENPEALRVFLSTKKRILDAGCGNGRVTALLRKYTDHQTVNITAIDLTAAEVAKRNLKHLENIQIYSKDLLESLNDLGEFDYIYCQEVLHHTSDPFKAFKNLVDLLSLGGEIAIYVYKKKAPAREFVDEFIRDKISHLDYEKAIEYCEQITALGKTLHELDQTVKIPKVELLEIEEGEYSVQRFVYHFFMKCFWNPRLSYDENTVINYDWYHPDLCSKHNLNEIREWFEKCGLDITHEYTDYYGITMRGKRTLK